MKFILFFCFCIFAFSESIESENEKLKRANEVLLKTLRELSVEADAESAIGKPPKGYRPNYAESAIANDDFSEDFSDESEVGGRKRRPRRRRRKNRGDESALGASDSSEDFSDESEVGWRQGNGWSQQNHHSNGWSQRNHHSNGWSQRNHHSNGGRYGYQDEEFAVARPPPDHRRHPRFGPGLESAIANDDSEDSSDDESEVARPRGHHWYGRL